MTKPLIQIGDEVREMTDTEFAQFEADRIADAELASQLLAQAQLKAEAKAAAQAKLAALGLTIQDLQSLGLIEPQPETKALSSSPAEPIS